MHINLDWNATGHAQASGWAGAGGTAQTDMCPRCFAGQDDSLQAALVLVKRGSLHSGEKHSIVWHALQCICASKHYNITACKNWHCMPNTMAIAILVQLQNGAVSLIQDYVRPNAASHHSTNSHMQFSMHQVGFWYASSTCEHKKSLNCRCARATEQSCEIHTDDQHSS